MSKIFVIAEAGVNHNGCEKTAIELVRVAARCGADAVKFQTFNADKLVTKDAAKAEYQANMTGGGRQHTMLQALELSEQAHQHIAEVCVEEGIEFMSTPFDEEAVDLLINLGMRQLKVPSGEITNLPFLKYLAAQSLPIILSTGMSDMSEIETAIETIRTVWNQSEQVIPGDHLTVLHCTSNYPAEFSDVKPARRFQKVSLDNSAHISMS